MMDAKERENVLANQLLLWDKYTKVTYSNEADAVVAKLADGIMPDGKPCSGKLVAKNKKQLVDMWYDYVRREYDARTAEQEAAAFKRKEALESGGGGNNPPAGEHGGGGVPAAAPVPGGEGTVEEILKSKIAALGGSIASLTGECEAAAGALALVTAKLEKAKAERTKAVNALKFLSKEAAK